MDDGLDRRLVGSTIDDDRGVTLLVTVFIITTSWEMVLFMMNTLFAENVVLSSMHADDSSGKLQAVDVFSIDTLPTITALLLLLLLLLLSSLKMLASCNS